MIKYLVLDYNGTLAVDGHPIPGIAEKLVEISQHLQIYILTSDTFGTVHDALAGLPVEIIVLSSRDHTHEKADFVMSLGVENTIAVGNGSNDHLMLEKAAIGIALIQAEGASAKAIRHADLVFTSIFDSLGAILEPKRMTASLRE